jgi:PAS domain S-box-containing protein
MPTTVWYKHTVDRLRDSNVTSVALAGTAGSDAGPAASPPIRPERLQFLLSAGPAVIYARAALHPHQLTFIGDNSAARLGYEPQELLENSRFWLSCIHPEDAGRIDAHLNHVLEHDRHVCEYRLLQPDGTYLWLCDEAQLIKDADGKALEIAGCLIDITARKKAEAERARGMEQMTDAQSMAHVGSWDWDMDTNTVHWSDELYRIFGRDRAASVTYDSVIQAVHPEDKGVLEDALERAWQGVRPFNIEFRIVRPDRAVRHLHSRGVVCRDPSGRPTRMYGTAQDISERKHAEDVLKESQERFLAFMRYFPGAAFIRDRAGRFYYANAVATQQHSEPGDWQGKSLEDVFPADVAARLLANDLRVLGSGEALQVVETTPGEHSARYWLVNKFPLPQPEGRPALLGGIGIDITEQKRTEEELRKSELQLRGMLEARERLAQDLHDGIIQGIYAVGFNLEECQRLIEEDQQSAAVKTIAGGISMLNGVIRDIRHFISGREPRGLTGKELRSQIVELAQTIEAAALLRLQVSVDPQAAARLTPDEARHILSIAREAMSNSLRHSHAKTATVSLRAKAAHIQFAVEDDGVGFDVDHTPHQGEGLRNMAARAGLINAKLEMTSVCGQGTRIVLDLPNRASHGSGPKRRTAADHRR